MHRKYAFLDVFKNEPALVAGAIGLLTFGLLTLHSIAPSIFPSYFIYIVAAIIAFYLFSHIEFDILLIFSKHLYVLSILSLILPLLIGEVTRGATRWIQIGSITVQPTELIRPFLILFFAQFLVGRKLNRINLAKAFILLVVPILLILVQPSLGVAVLTLAGFVGVAISLEYNKKLLLFLGGAVAVVSPLFWFVLAPYQKQRVMALISPVSDPSGAGYNSIQSMIAVGSGKLTGRGLGEGIQTQLSFLPERHTDFIFASIAEELGLLGAILLVGITFFVLYRVVRIIEEAKDPVARAFAAGVFATLFLQVMVHIGMNMGLLPITGQPLPLVSAGGSSLVATMAMFGILLQAKKKEGYSR
jgi:rod shape determining protein RodA